MKASRFTHSHRADRVAVIAALHADYTLALRLAFELPVLVGKLERDFNGVGAIIRVVGTV